MNDHLQIPQNNLALLDEFEPSHPFVRVVRLLRNKHLLPQVAPMKPASYWSHTFLPGLIQRDGIVFDFGVNNGGFSRIVAPLCARVVGFEPDSIWQGRWNLPDNVTVIPKALAGSKGALSFHVNAEMCSSLHYSEAGSRTAEVEAITLEEALALAPEGRIDLIKMDIEGEELAVLSGAPAHLFDRVAQMTVEFHDFLDPQSLPAIRAVIARMRSLGFRAFCFSWRSHGDLMFIHRSLAPLSLMQRLWLLARYKYMRGIARMLHIVPAETPFA